MKADFVADVGNTALKWATGRQGKIVDIHTLILDASSDWLELFAHIQSLKNGESHNWAIAGSSPERRDRLAQLLIQHGQNVLVLKDGHQLPIEVNVRCPEKVGIDRLLNAIAVASRSSAESIVAIDAGTAVTVDLVERGMVGKCVFQGGAVFPGLGLMCKALHGHTALLPDVKVEGPLDPPGKSTEEAIAAGVFHAVVGGIERLIACYEEQARQPPAIFIGGGDGPMLAAAMTGRACTLWPEMTLEGIRLSAEHV